MGEGPAVDVGPGVREGPGPGVEVDVGEGPIVDVNVGNGVAVGRGRLVSASFCKPRLVLIYRTEPFDSARITPAIPPVE